ncbi:MAG: ABC transporter permease subunit [Synergistaceae bacterium]|nr:ABC transporter permease subunit [Synergistaceae bacterium]
MLAVFCVSRCNIRNRGIFNIFAALPMLIPSVSHGMGLIIMFGRNGVLTNFLDIEIPIYGFWGIVAGSIFYSFSLAYLMLENILRYEDTSPYEAAEILGISRLRQFTSITVPYMRKPLIAVTFAVFTLIATDYGVPLTVGGRYVTLPVMMYEEVVGLLNFGSGSVIGAILLIPAAISFILDSFTHNIDNQNYLMHTRSLRMSSAMNAAARVYCGIVCMIALLPILSFLILAFVSKYPRDMSFTLHNAANSFRKGANVYLANSLTIALCVAVSGVIVSYFAAYLTARSEGASSRVLHFASITSIAIPGIVLGIAYVLLFRTTFLYGTIGILILVNLVHFFASPYLMAYNSLNKVNKNLEAVGMTLGVERWRILRDVIVPLTASTIVEMWSYFFINSMMTISAVAFLSNTKIKPLSMMIPSFEANMQFESAAFVSLLILAANVAMKGLMGTINGILRRRNKSYADSRSI